MCPSFNTFPLLFEVTISFDVKKFMFSYINFMFISSRQAGPPLTYASFQVGPLRRILIEAKNVNQIQK